MSTGEYDQAEELIARSCRAAEENNWFLLLAWCQGFSGELQLLRWLDQAEPELLARAVEELKLSEERWRYCDEAGEFYAYLAVAVFLAGDAAGAHATLARAREHVHSSWLSARAWLDLAEAVVNGIRPAAPLAWFHERGFARPARLVERVGRVVSFE